MLGEILMLQERFRFRAIPQSGSLKKVVIWELTIRGERVSRPVKLQDGLGPEGSTPEKLPNTCEWKPGVH